MMAGFPGKGWMNRNEKENILLIDQEWVSLMESARKLGLTIEEVQRFLSEFKQQ
nr:DNA-binding anti-repressor SinI [Priestia aryabhattai]